MLLRLTENVRLDASCDDVWRLLRDTPRLASLLPGVQSVTPLDDPVAEAYSAQVRDNIGPFKITLMIEVRIIETLEPSLLKIALKGSDSAGWNRVTGWMHIVLASASSGTQMNVEASIEVLGKLATLGAVPIRRKTTASFGEFARNIQGQFAKKGP